MNRSRYLQQVVEESNQIRAAMAKKTLTSIIILVVVAIACYVGLPLMDPRATQVSSPLAVICVLMGLFFLLRFFKLHGDVSSKVLSKCEEEIQKNLVGEDSFDTFDNDMMHPAYGEHPINDMKVRVGQTFVLFQSMGLAGPKFNILRADNLGIFDVHYITQGGGSDIGVDIKDKNGKFTRSVMTSDKNKFYAVLNAMEKAKNYANGIDDEQNSADQDDSFVEEVKEGVKHQDKKNYTKIGIFGILFSFFLVIAGTSSGVGFIYAGFILFALSIIFTITVNIKLRRKK